MATFTRQPFGVQKRRWETSELGRVTMDQDTRAEIEKLHGRINDVKERVVNLEAQQPHINAALARIESGVAGLYRHVSKAIWLFIGLIAAAVVKFIVSGGLILPH